MAYGTSLNLFGFVFGALCMLLGFFLIVRGIGGEDSESTIKLIGIEIRTSRVGPGVVFALFGLVLTIYSISRLPAIGQNPVEEARARPVSPIVPPAVPPQGVLNSSAINRGTPVAPEASTASSVAASDESAKPKEATQVEQPPPSDSAASAAASLVQNASFDCNKARTYAEVTVCHDSRLAAQDQLYHNLYRSAESDDVTGDVRRQGIVAIHRRNQCETPDCLRTWYDDRINSLRIQNSEN